MNFLIAFIPTLVIGAGYYHNDALEDFHKYCSNNYHLLNLQPPYVNYDVNGCFNDLAQYVTWTDAFLHASLWAIAAGVVFAILTYEEA